MEEDAHTWLERSVNFGAINVRKITCRADKRQCPQPRDLTDIHNFISCLVHLVHFTFNKPSLQIPAVPVPKYAHFWSALGLPPTLSGPIMRQTYPPFPPAAVSQFGRSQGPTMRSNCLWKSPLSASRSGLGSVLEQPERSTTRSSPSALLML